MTCVTDDDLGPCYSCGKITDGSKVKEDVNGKRWIVGYECPKCKENHGAS
jgi:hypothetical protein